MSEVRLSDFIATTLYEISQGVDCANDRAVARNATGAGADYRRGMLFTLRNNLKNPEVPEIAFDIAVTASDDSSSEAGVQGGISISILSLGGKSSNQQSSSSEVVQRIRFEIGVAYDFQRHSSVESGSPEDGSDENPSTQP